MMTPGKQLAHRWIDEVWNRRDATAIDRLFAKDGISHGAGPNGVDVVGPAGFAPTHSAFLGAFADLTMTIDELIEEGDRVAVRWHASGTHTGHGLGMAPTQKRMTITGLSMFRARNGQIVESWNNFDMLGMHRQLETLGALAGG